MLERPSELISYRFDQLADQINKRVMPDEADVDRYVGLEHLDPDSLRIRRWGDTSEVESTKLLFKPGDIIFGKRRVYQRKVAVADFEGICSAHAMVLRAKPDTVLPEFLPFFMQSDLYMERALSISVGSLSPTINWKALAKEKFLLPPIQEQSRFVEAVSAIDCAIDEYVELESATMTLKESFLKAELSKNKNSYWNYSSLVDVAESKRGSFGNGPFGSNLLTSELNSNSGVPVIYVRDVCNGRYEKQESMFVSEQKAEELASSSVVSGDLLIAKVGDPPGIAAVYPEGMPNAIITQDVIRLRPEKTVARSDYLCAMLNSTVGRRIIASIAVEGTRQRISTGDLKKVRFPIPDIENQTKIVGRLAKIEQAETAARFRLRALQSQRKLAIAQLSECVS